MAGSGAGVNAVRCVLLDNVGTTAPAVANPTTAYGVIGQNDSGGQMTEAQGYSKWVVMLLPTSAVAPVGFAFSLYYTVSPYAYLTWQSTVRGITPYGNPPPVPPLPGSPRQQVILPQPVARLGYSNAAGFWPGVNPYAWVLAEGPSSQGGTGTIANPMTPASPMMYINYPVDGIRVVLTTVGTAGSCQVVAKAVP